MVKVEDFGGFAICILHFCTTFAVSPATVLVPRDPNRGGVISYCTDRPSLVLGLVPRDKMRVAVPAENRMGLPVESAESKRCVGGVRGTKDNAAGFSRASTKGGPRDRGAGSWERLRTSTTVPEVCVDEGWEASRGSLVVVVVEGVACGWEWTTGRVTRPKESWTIVTSDLGSEMVVCVGEARPAVELDCCATMRGWSCGVILRTHGGADVSWGGWSGFRCVGAYVCRVKLGESVALDDGIQEYGKWGTDALLDRRGAQLDGVQLTK